MYGNKYRINARAVIYQDGKILAVLHRDRRTGKPVNHWATPGGGVEEKETLIDGLKREIKEELSVEANVGRLLFCMQWFNKWKKTEMLDFFFLIENYKDFLSLDLCQTAHGIEEIVDVKFTDPRDVNFLPEFLMEIDIRDVCENVREVAVYSYLNEV